jgi:hypothetical protein
VLIVDVRRDLVAQVALVLDDACDEQRPVGLPGDLDGGGGALVGVDAAEEEQVIAGDRSGEHRPIRLPHQ